jgi:hypothetical protein
MTEYWQREAIIKWYHRGFFMMIKMVKFQDEVGRVFVRENVVPKILHRIEQKYKVLAICYED